jgi:hypothetical protein
MQAQMSRWPSGLSPFRPRAPCPPLLLPQIPPPLYECVLTAPRSLRDQRQLIEEGMEPPSGVVAMLCH